MRVCVCVCERMKNKDQQRSAINMCKTNGSQIFMH